MMHDNSDVRSHAFYAGHHPPTNSMPASTGFMAGSSDVELWIPAPDSLMRQPPQGVSFPRNGRDELNYHFMDIETAELYSKSRSQEEEILLLRKQMADACIKELQLLKEKHILEGKLSDLQMALGEKQNDAIADVFRQMTQRKGYIEDNLRVANDIKVVEEDIYAFSSSLLSLLAEYGVRPPVLDACTISNSVKRLYQNAHWKIRSAHVGFDDTNNLMGKQAGDVPLSNSRPGPRTSKGPFMDPKMHDFHQSNRNTGEMHHKPFIQSRSAQEYDMMDVKEMKFAPSPDVQYQLSSNKPSEVGVATTTDYLDGDLVEAQTRKTATMSQVFMPTIHERQASSLSEGEISLPGIEGFQIIGEPKPGCTLRACGYPTNGTSLCVFQWVRHLQNGTRQSIEGATVPNYVVTADDVDTLLAVDCIPMDDSGRQGELVSHFANNHNKITCDPDIQHEIEMHISAGRAIFNVLLLKESSEDWEPTNLFLKRSSYQIKLNNSDFVVAEEKYSPDQYIKVPYGLSTQFVLVCSDGTSLPLSTNGTSHPYSTDNDLRLRDIIVLTMRNFQAKALDGKRKGKA